LEDNYGSMIRGQIFGARERKRRGEIAKDRAPKFSFDEGLQVLTDTLAQHLKGDLRCACRVTAIEKKAGIWIVTGRAKGTNLETGHSAVIYTSPSYAALDIRFVCDGRAVDWTALGAIKYPPVVSVVLGFKRQDVTHPCQGFGMLIPKIEGFKSLGTIFSSSLFPNRAPAGHLTLTSYVGGERYPELAVLPQEKLIELVCEDLRVLLGVRGQPVFAHSVLYERAIPQYNVGYGRFKDLMNDIEARAPGFFFAGHFRDGISLSDSIVSGCNVAERVAAALKPA
jgi:oxygen-dependent protoporphyrinogen oxidase